VFCNTISESLLFFSVSSIFEYLALYGSYYYYEMIFVICIEGCHGSGKSEICRALYASGFDVLDEGFMDMPTFNLPPQSLIMESIWITNWMQRLLRLQKEKFSSGDKIVFCDRSPFSAVYYAGRNGFLLEPMVKQQIEDLRKFANIHICTVSLKVEKELLWRRIQERLLREPERMKYNEHIREWMEVTYDWYNSRNWDYFIENNENTIKELMQTLLSHLCSQVSNFGEICKSSYDYQHVEARSANSTGGTSVPNPTENASLILAVNSSI
jgi:thymidylate kinase